MEPNNNNNRAEADRWVSIAEKLLTARDLIGSKTFAIRARESNPRLEPADQILAVADTLIAGEVRINNQHDWYAVLQLVRLTRDSDIVATQYRRLALLLSPVKNRLAFADQAFKLVSDAWSVLSNPAKKALYDNELSLHDSAGLTQKQQPFWKTPPPPPPRSSSSSGRDKKVTEEPNLPGSKKSTGSASFWTACPYCYNMYEYARVYEECTLRCQNCKRAFHAVTIPSPVGESGNDAAYFCCWGYFPLGFSANDWENAKDKAGSGNWTPFSPMFNCPVQPQNGAQFNVGGAEGNTNVSGPKTANVNARGRSGAKPKAVLIDDDDEVFMEVSDPSEDSDYEWESTRKKKKGKNVKGKSPASKNVKKAAQAEMVKKSNQNVMEQVFGSGFDDLQAGSLMQEDLGVANATMGDMSMKVVGSSSKKQYGKHGNDLGNLDLNVEFSNEVEEPARGLNVGNRTGNGEEDNIEGIGFFEGLDEFLSSLPILSVVGDDKGKAS